MYYRFYISNIYNNYFFQKYLLIILGSMLFAYLYNAHIEVIILYAHSRTIQIFYDYINFKAFYRNIFIFIIFKK